MLAADKWSMASQGFKSALAVVAIGLVGIMGMERILGGIVAREQAGHDAIGTEPTSAAETPVHLASLAKPSTAGPAPDFWSVIDQARGASAGPKTPSATSGALRRVLQQYPSDQVVAFETEYERNLTALNSCELWGAGDLITGGMDADSFHYFRDWIIGKGKACFDAAKADPDSLAPFVDKRAVDNEALEYAALHLLSTRGVNADPRGQLDPDGPCTGEPIDRLTEAAHYPKLSRMR